MIIGILNTKGTVGEVSGELRSVLGYLGGAKPDSDYTRELDKAVQDVRSDKKWRREYMFLSEKLRESRRLGERRMNVKQVRRFRNRLDEKELAEFCILEPNAVRAILEAIDAHPDWDDDQIVENLGLS